MARKKILSMSSSLVTTTAVACVRLSDSMVERIKTSKAKMRRARLGKGGGGGGKNGRFSHFFLLNDFPPPSRSLEKATTAVAAKTSL